MSLFGSLWKGAMVFSASSGELLCKRLISSQPSTFLGRICTRPLSLVPMLGLCPCQVREFAARKGTREKWYKEKRARKLRAVKKELAPSKWIKTSKALLPTRIRTTSKCDIEPIDDVYVEALFKQQQYTIKQVIEMHRETHHPTVFNQPNAFLYLSLELDMSLEKKTKFLDVFSEVIPIPYIFKSGRTATVLAFCKKDEDQKAAVAAGADAVGGAGLIKQIQAGQVLVGEFNHIVCNADMVNDVHTIRGLLKKKFPSIARGTLGIDMKSLVERFKDGLEYVAEKDNIQHNFGWIDVAVGSLNMPSEHLEANIAAAVKAVCTHRHPKLGPFITMAFLLCPPSKKKIAIDVVDFMPLHEETEEEDEADVLAK